MEWVSLALALYKIAIDLQAQGAKVTPEQEAVLHDAATRLNAQAHAEDKTTEAPSHS